MRDLLAAFSLPPPQTLRARRGILDPVIKLNPDYTLASVNFVRADESALDPADPYFAPITQSGPIEVPILSNDANFTGRRAAMKRALRSGAPASTGLQFLVRARRELVVSTETPHALACGGFKRCAQAANFSRLDPTLSLPTREQGGSLLVGKVAVAATVVYSPVLWSADPASTDKTVTGFVSIGFSWGQAR